MKIDLHVHTSEISLCGKVRGCDAVKMYKDAGYDAIVITNHFNSDGVYHFSHQGRQDYLEAYIEGYELARRAGCEIGLTVLLGYELRFDGSNNDYLVYGMPYDVASDYKRIFAMNPREFSQIANERGFLFYQAHPFRNSMNIIKPSYLFGIEVYNGNPRHDSRNDIAQMWADKFSLRQISGSDFHQPEDIAIGGIQTECDVSTLDDLIKILKDGSYTLIKN